MYPDGQLLGGRYELTALIATGGMGQVWEARDTRLHRDVAVKVLRSEYTGDPTFVARFRAEAQLAAGLVHPNIATLFDYGEVVPAHPRGERLAYLVMELVRGESLAQLMRREVRVPPGRTLDVLRQCAAGLAAAHAAGVVHRDVKPGNVLLGTDGTVKLTDFGVAVSTGSVPLTQTGQVIGTPHYLSPEQAAGSRATPASDVYALGLIGYECLSGHRAFDAETAVQVALLHLNATPAPLPDDVPVPVRQLIEATLVKDPAVRFPDGAAFHDAIDDVLAGRTLTPIIRTAELAGGDDPASSWTWRRRLLVPLAGLLVLAAASVGGMRLAGGNDPAATTSAPPPAAPAVQLVDLSPGSYTGRPVSEVQAELAARGLQVTLRPLTTPDVPNGQVIAVDPAGALSPGAAVTVTYAVAPPVVPAVPPEPAPAAAALAVVQPAPAAARAPVAAPGPAPAAVPATAPVVPQTPVVEASGGGTAVSQDSPDSRPAPAPKDKAQAKDKAKDPAKGQGKDKPKAKDHGKAKAKGKG